MFLCMLANRLPVNVHLIVASRDRFLPAGETVRLGSRVYQIGTEQLRLNHTELAVYAHRCGDVYKRQGDDWQDVLSIILLKQSPTSYIQKTRMMKKESDFRYQFAAQTASLSLSLIHILPFSPTSAKMETEENTQRWFVNGG